ncbi:hypothetical protein MMC34_007406 [Xylographa carneopallida]|nr:hypothetical protein [Xylographa carneopallida]
MVNPALLGQTIAVYDQSGKVISNSKHLLNVFKEAKSAYRERKAEIVASRHAHNDEKHGRKATRAHNIDDGNSSYRFSPRSIQGSVRRKPVPERRHSGETARSATTTIYPSSNRRFEQDLRPRDLRRSSRSSTSSGFSIDPRRDMARRNTTVYDPPGHRSAPPSPIRSRSVDDIDMNLAYGELPPDLVVARKGDEAELKGLVGTVSKLLDEAKCVHYSVTAIIANLQKNPEAMAAVALTLAEISNIVTKMSPGAVMAMKGSAPAVFALLASPQFLIAAGVGVGVTIVAFGGYKIIKKIKAKHANEEVGMDEMIEIGGDFKRIENWRRGISEVEERSVGTSVEGEFITPMAANLSRLNLQEERIRDSRREARGLNSVKGEKSSKGGSYGRGSKSSKTSKPDKDKKEKKEKAKKDKKPSPLRLMFQ